MRDAVQSAVVQSTSSSRSPSPFLYGAIAVGVLLFICACIFLVISFQSVCRYWRLLVQCFSRIPFWRSHRLDTLTDLQLKRRSINSRGFWDYNEPGASHDRRAQDLEWNAASSFALPAPVHLANQPSYSVLSSSRAGIPVVPTSSTSVCPIRQPQDIELRSQDPEHRATGPISPVSPLSLSKSTSASSISSLDLDSPRPSAACLNRLETNPESPKPHWIATFAGAAKHAISNVSPRLPPITRPVKKQTLSFACVGVDRSGSRVFLGRPATSSMSSTTHSTIQTPSPTRVSAIRGLASNMTYMGPPVAKQGQWSQTNEQPKPLPFPPGSGFRPGQRKPQSGLSKSIDFPQPRRGTSDLSNRSAHGISAPLASQDLTLRLQRSYKLTDREKIVNGQVRIMPTIPELSLSPPAPITPGTGTPKLASFMDEAHNHEDWPLPLVVLPHRGRRDVLLERNGVGDMASEEEAAACHDSATRKRKRRM